MERIGKYEIVSLLGEGGMGAVYKGYDAVIGRDVAIKVIHERALDEPTVKARFYREARSAGRLSHKNITVLYDIDEADGTPFLVMEYLEGRDLRALLKAGVVLTDIEKLDIALQIAHGLRYAHAQGVIHRDVKPANIRVLPDGRVKIIDFGIARIQNEAQRLTQTNLSVGTPRYMSPEQITGETIDHRSDIFSYGVLLYELVIGRSPFTGDHITTLIHNILQADPQPITAGLGTLSGDLYPIIEKCLAKAPADRYQDFEGVIQALQDIRLLSKNRPASPRPDTTLRKDHAGLPQPNTTLLLAGPSALDKTLVSPPKRAPHAPDKTTPSPRALAASKTASAPRGRALKITGWAALGVVLAAAGGYFFFRPTPPAADAPQTPGVNASGSLAVLDSARAVADSIRIDTLSEAGAVLPPDEGTARADEPPPRRAAADQEQRAVEQQPEHRAVEQQPLDEREPVADAEPAPPEEPPSSGVQADADRAREAMQAVKSSVPAGLQQTDAYRRALGYEAAGRTAYTRRAYDRAAVRFADARTAFDEAAATTPQEAAAMASVQALTRQLKTSLEQEDAATMIDVFYGDFAGFFNTASNIAATVHAGPVQVKGALATVDVRVTLSYRDDQNTQQDGLVSYRWTLEERSSGWVITQVAAR